MISYISLQNWPNGSLIFRKEIQKLDRQDGQAVENQYVHPHSGSSDDRYVHPHSGSSENMYVHPYSGSSENPYVHPHSGSSEATSPSSRRPRSALRRKPLADPLYDHQGPQTREDACVQTEAKLLDEYDQVSAFLHKFPLKRVFFFTKLRTCPFCSASLATNFDPWLNADVVISCSKNHNLKESSFGPLCFIPKKQPKIQKIVHCNKFYFNPLFLKTIKMYSFDFVVKLFILSCGVTEHEAFCPMPVNERISSDDRPH
jgi:hypothetical protein